MKNSQQLRRCLLALISCALAAPQSAPAQETKEYVPKVGQAGKDVVWVPTPPELVEKMLDLAQVTSSDFVMDLGSGDGRNVIAAAKRGAHGVGVEFNPEMVELSRRNAAREGVSDKATFVQGDMYQADISKASVLALFLLTRNMVQLRPKFLDLPPGTRIVANTFGMEDWEPDLTDRTCDNFEDGGWCTALLWIVPAKVAGAWRLGDGELVLDQKYQKVTGSILSGGAPIAIERGQLRGTQLTFFANGVEYTGTVNGDRIEGTRKSASRSEPWTATRTRSAPVAQ
jgi:precorrin-6B methylase 2